MDNRETIKLRIFPRSICGEVVMDNLHQLATVGPYVVGYSGPYEIRCIEYRPEIDPSSIVMIFDPVTLYNRRSPCTLTQAEGGAQVMVAPVVT